MALDQGTTEKEFWLPFIHHPKACSVGAGGCEGGVLGQMTLLFPCGPDQDQDELQAAHNVHP